MGTDNRAHSWRRTCPVCGNRYRLTNFMYRDDPEHPRLKTDTHVLACRRKAREKASTEGEA